MSIVIEIRAAEGGDDAKLLVRDHVATYLRVAGRECL
jgi:protein subunit release factor A